MDKMEGMTLIFVYLFLAVLGLCCCMGFSLVVARGGYSSFGARTSHCSGFSCSGGWALEHADFSSRATWAH